MQWDEDTWEDVSDPPSPVRGKTRHSVRPNDQQYGQNTLKKTLHNGHLPLEKPKRVPTKGSELSECWSLLNKTRQENIAVEPPDLEGAHKLAQELLQSYQVLNAVSCKLSEASSEGDAIFKCYGHGPDVNQTETREYLPAYSSKPKSFGSFRTNSTSEKKYKSDHAKRCRDIGQRTDLKCSRIKTAVASSQQDNLGLKTSQSDNTKVPQSLCNAKASEQKHQQKLALQRNSTNRHHSSQLVTGQDESHSVRSEVKFKENVSVRDFDLHEYKKLRISAQQRVLGGNPYEDEEEERAKAIACVVFCIMGLGLIIGLVCLLSHYVEDKELEQMQAQGDDENLTELMNQVYYHRVADLIRVASKTEGRLRHDTRILKLFGRHDPAQLCDLVPPYLSE